MLQFIVFIIGLYALLESLHSAEIMGKGDRWCIVAQQCAIGITGGYAMLIAAKGHVDAGDLIWATTLFLVLLPRMLYRIGIFKPKPCERIYIEQR